MLNLNYGISKKNLNDLNHFKDTYVVKSKTLMIVKSFRSRYKSCIALYRRVLNILTVMCAAKDVIPFFTSQVDQNNYIMYSIV